MADIFNFFVYDDRSIQFELAEPIMLEDTNVTQFKFRIPKSINGFDMTGWSWWFVYVNAQKEKFSVPLSLSDDEDEPDVYANAVYTVDYGMSGIAGAVSFALEAINADATTSEILNEWHTYTYTTRVISTLQGNQAEFEQSEIDVIAGMIQDMLAQVREMIEEGGIGGTSDDIENASSVSGSTVSDALNSLSDEIANLEGGAPTPAATVSAMVDITKIYLYTGSETGYNAGHWYYYSGGQWVDGGQYGEAASMSEEVKAALLACFQNLAFLNDDDYYQNLYNALYPPIDLVSISCVYTQSVAVHEETPLNSLKSDLVVTAHYTDSTTETVTAYTLSGTLAIGTSTITVTYGGKNTTFNVIVTEIPIPSEYQQVEWIGFDGNSRIVTDATGASSHSYEAKAEMVGDDEQFIFGLCGSSTAQIEIGKAANENRLFLYASSSLSVSNISGLMDYPVFIDAEYIQGGSRTLTATVNNIPYTNTSSASKGASGYKLVVGSAGYNEQRYGYYGKIYYLKYYEDGSLASDLVPCYRISDDAIGLYDKVARAFYPNSGSGTLTKGADV